MKFSKSLAGLLASVLLIFCWRPVFAGPAEDPEREFKSRRREADSKAAKICNDIARWCLKKDMRQSASKYCKLALDLDGTLEDAHKLDIELESINPFEKGSEGDAKELEEKISTLASQRAKEYLKLADWALDFSMDRNSVLLIREAHDLAPRGEDLRKFLKEKISLFIRKNREELLGPLMSLHDLCAGKDEKIEKDVRNAIVKRAKKNYARIKCSTHEMEYYLSLPDKWKEDKSWPLLVCMAGTSGDYEGSIRDASEFGKREGFICITPMTFSNSSGAYPFKNTFFSEDYEKKMANAEMDEKLGEDDDALVKILADLEEIYGCDEKRVYLTGFSGGAITASRLFLRYPDRFSALVLSSPNFLEDHVKATKREKPDPTPIRLLVGTLDTLGPKEVFPQSKAALEFFQEKDYSNVKIEELRNKGHEPFFKELWDLVIEADKKKR